MGELFSKLLTKEAYEHPLATVVIVLAGAFGAGFTFNSMFVHSEEYDKHVEIEQKERVVIKDEMSEIKAGVNNVQKELGNVNMALCEISYSSSRGTLEQKISDAEAEVFRLSRLEDNGEAEPDDLLRLDRRRTELNQLSRDLDKLMAGGCK